MDEWWRHLSGKPFYWALDGSNPAADYWMLRHVVERPAEARALQAARLALQESPPVEALKAALAAPTRMLWSPRYQSTLWALRLLAELEVPGNDEAVAEALDRVLDQGAAPDEEPAPVNVEAILLHTAAALGFGGDPRAQRLHSALQARLAEGPLPPMPAAALDWLVQSAMAMAALLPAQRDAASVSLLQQRLGAVAPGTVPRYRRYGFPTFDHPDDVALARSALLLGIEGPWLAPWVRLVEGAQDEQGLWQLRRLLPLPAAVRFAGEVEGAPSRWLSAQALYILRAFYGE